MKLEFWVRAGKVLSVYLMEGQMLHVLRTLDNVHQRGSRYPIASQMQYNIHAIHLSSLCRTNGWVFKR